MRKLLLQIIFVLGICGCIAWYYQHSGWSPLIEAVSLLLGFVATIETRPINIAGIWAYRITKPGHGFSHAGRFELIQNGNTPKIYGHRFHWINREGQLMDDDIPWESHWGQVSGQIPGQPKNERYLRFDYSINVDDTNAEALCRVGIEDNGLRLYGKYFELAPPKDAGVVPKWGTCTFTKLRKGQKLERPIAGYDIHGYEKDQSVFVRPQHQ
jgi:hypothetical protein